MEIIVTTEYHLHEQKSTNKINIDLSEYIKDNELDTDDEIEDLLSDYLWNSVDRNELLPDINIEDLNYISDINWNISEEELQKEYGHLLIPAKKITCCDKQPSNYFYCPYCGKKLK